MRNSAETETGQIVLVWCYRGYRPGIVKDIGKRKTLIAWTDSKEEWIENDRIRTPESLKDRSWMIRALKMEEEIHGRY